MITEPKLENGIFEDIYKTSFSQTGIYNVLTNKSILSILENVAGNHSATVHYSFNDLNKLNLTWVLLNWKLKIIKRLKPDVNITVKTWGRAANKLAVFRDFKIFDQDNNLCAIASSKWCLIDTNKGKLAKMPEDIDKIYHGFHNESVFGIDDLPKLLPPNSTPISTDTYRIRRFDLDINKHVHNLNYLSIAYEIIPDDVYDNKELNNVEILFKKELKYGDTVKSYLYEEDNSYIIVMKSLNDSITHAIVKLYNN